MAILEAQKAEFFNVTASKNDEDINDELKDLKKIQLKPKMMMMTMMTTTMMMMTSLQKDLKMDEEERNDFDGNFD